MSTTERKWRQAYNTYAPALVLFCLLTAAFASIGTLYNARTQGAETAARVDTTTALLGCFDNFASDLSGSLPPVRAASAERDDRLADAMKAFLKVITASEPGAVPSVAEQRRQVRLITVALSKFLDANNTLSMARAANPYPAPPSLECNTALPH